MRKHGWQLPYHPLQVVAVAAFLAIGFAYYVFFAPFVGKKLIQYIAMGIYTPLILCVFGLYIWCAAADPADPGVFKSKKYLKILESKKLLQLKESKLGGESTSCVRNDDSTMAGGKSVDESRKGDVVTTAENLASEIGKRITTPHPSCCFTAPLTFISCASTCKCSKGESSELQLSEDGMFYCSLCEWLNNCIGKRNYQQFFTLMVSALLMLVIQWSTGILVLICCFVEHKRFSVDISSRLGSSFTLAPFVIVVTVCTILAMIATLPLAQLFFFHILLMKKGISTYDYIITMREQDQQGIGGQQSPQMSAVSSITGLSNASSFNTFQQGAWCTHPRLFVEDQFDVVQPDRGSVSSWGKKMAMDEPIKKKNPAAVKISPWTLTRLSAEDISKVAAEARKKSKILQPVTKQEETVKTFGGGSHRMVIPNPETNNRRLVGFKSVSENTGNDFIPETLSSLAPLQLKAQSTFQTSQAMNSSSEISLESLDHHPIRVSLPRAEEACQLSNSQKGMMPLPRSTSDRYDASGGEGSDRVPTRIVHRMSNWSNVLFYPNRDESVVRVLAMGSSSSQANSRNL